MIAKACRPLLESCAFQEKSTAKSALALFMRDGRNLGELARQRVRDWEDHAPDLDQAYKLKNRLEKLLRIRSLDERRWGEWKEAAGLLSSVDTTPVVELVESHWLQLLAYERKEFFDVFEFWLNEVVSKIDVQGGHSFSAARVAFLDQYKKRPGAKRSL